jgi:hypothetical protein
MKYPVQSFRFLRSFSIPILAVLLFASSVWVFRQFANGEKHLAPEAELPGQSAEITSQMSQQPLLFVENRGQWDPAAKFMARTDNFSAWFENDAIILQQEHSNGEMPVGINKYSIASSTRALTCGYGKPEDSWNMIFCYPPEPIPDGSSFTAKALKDWKSTKTDRC